MLGPMAGGSRGYAMSTAGHTTYGARQYGAVTLFYAHGLAAVYDSSKGITLNGTDVSAIADQVPWLPLSAPVAYDLSQGTAANQPLYTGAPTYNGRPSIQYVAANADRLFLANTNLIADNPCTFVAVQRLRVLGGAQSYFFGNGTGGTGIGFGEAAGGRNAIVAGVTNRIDGVISTTAAEVWIGTDSGSGVPAATLMINGVDQAITNSGANRVDAGATAEIEIGAYLGGGLNADVDDLFKVIFITSIPDSVKIRISHAYGATYGVVA